MTGHIKITDREIQALVDNELDSDDARAIKAIILETPAYLRRYEELARQKQLLRGWWDAFHHEN